MRRAVLGGLAALMGISALAVAQEQANEPEATMPRLEIRVLRDPYDLASFYRSGERPYFTYGVPSYEAHSSEGGFYASLRARHTLSSFYRQGGSGRYSGFWQSGYGARPLVAPGRYGPAYRDTIGENGDLYLFAPFLAGVGPLAGAFFR